MLLPMNPLLLTIPEEFESERLILRAPRVQDAPFINEAVCESLDELRPWMAWAQSAPTPEESEATSRRARAQWLLREDLTLRLWLKGSEEFVGGGGLHRMDWRVPKFEIGYWIRTRFAGQGLMTEAVGAISDFAFEVFSARRVEIRADERNLKSWRVAERAGFQLEGTLRHDARETDGTLRNTRIYAKIRPDL